MQCVVAADDVDIVSVLPPLRAAAKDSATAREEGMGRRRVRASGEGEWGG